MFLRTSIVCLLSLLGACSSAGTSSDAAEQGSGKVVVRSLAFVRGDRIGVLPNMTAELAVTYADLLGGDVAGIEIDFALTGSAPGASLTPSSAVTDSTGTARTTLRVGSTTGDLQVRARTADGQLTQFIQVSVTEALGSMLAVTVQYQGLRELATYTVTSLPGMSCKAALQSGLAGDVSFTVPASSVSPVSFSVGSGLTTAIVGFGRDATGAKLALGCKEFTAMITANQADALPAIVLTLDNQALSFDNALQVALQLDVGAAAQRLSDTSASAVAAALAASGRDAANVEADFYLDAVAASLTKLGDTAALAALTDKRSASTLASSLTAALTQANVGPKALGAELGALLLDRAAELTLSSSYHNGALGAVSALGALSANGTEALSLSLVPSASMIASFSSDSAQLRVSTLSIGLPLGDYGVAVLDALQAPNTGSSHASSSIAAAAGCSSRFGPWWTTEGLTSVCDVSVAVAACQTATTTLVAQVATALQALNALAPALQLSGTVQAEDRDDDSQIDDLGPTDISGNWGSDRVVASLSVPVQTAFAH
ncbi:MAG: hypothetical protein JWN04_1271 [Myxococcaceae bacterium]|nr:hypothetical protein [Myxococcaceae bacterium]